MVGGDRFQAMADGSRVVFQTQASVRPTILYCSRQNFAADSTTRIIGAFRAEGFGVLVYQAPYEVGARQLDPEVRKLVPPDSIEARARSLTRALAALDEPPALVVGQSSGARIASLVADACGVRGLVLLSYPFRHAALGDEPERYAHLAHLRTPCLIVQGVDDKYGGREVASRYRLSPSVRLKFVRGGHSLDVIDDDRADIFAAIDELLDDIAVRR